MKQRNKIRYVDLACLFVGLITSFMSDIIVYETTEGVKFNYEKLFKNPLLYVLIIIEVVSHVWVAAIREVDKEDTGIVEKVIELEMVKIIEHIDKNLEDGDFDNADKLLEFLVKFREYTDERGDE